MPLRLKLVFTLDSLLLVAACALEHVPFTGLSLHEWIALATGLLMLLHVMLSWAWITATLKRLTTPDSWRARFNFLLNVCLFASVVVTLFSGVMLSEVALPVFGIRLASGDMAWRYIHNRFSNYVVFFVVLHLGLNWDWASAAARKLLLTGSVRGAK